MSSEECSSTILGLIKDFETASSPQKSFTPPPYSMRLTVEERAFLEEHCGGKPWSVFIRERVFGDQAGKRKPRRRPKVDDEKLALVLSQLGHSHLSSNVNQLAKSANMGVLDISPETDRQLQEASDAILAMRDLLIVALGLSVK